MRSTFFIISMLTLVLSQRTAAIAAPITFDLRDASIESIDEVASFMLTQGGITATVSANVGVLNQTAGSFGINHPSGGDPTSLIDDVNAVEAVTLIFDADVVLNAIQLSEMTTSESASITIAGGTPQILNGTAPANDLFAFSSPVLTGQSIVLSHDSGNGFSLDNFTVTAAVPEPSALVLLAMGAISVIGYRRKTWRAFRNA